MKLQGKSKKDLEQDHVHELLEKSNFRGAVVAGTGFGKSRVGVRAAMACVLLEIASNSLLNRKALILVPFEHLKDRFSKEIVQMYGEEALKHFHFECYASIRKLDPSNYCITVCDEAHLGLTDLCEQYYSKLTGPLIFLTATLPEDPIYRFRLLNHVPLVYSISIDECVKRGFVAPYHIVCVSVELTDKETALYATVSKNYGYWSGKLGFQPFDTATYILRNQKVSGKDELLAALGFFRAIRQRKLLVDHAENKIVLCKEMMDIVPGKKLIFGGDNAFTDKISAAIEDSAVYHSKISPKKRIQAIEDFRTGKVTALCSTKALNQGLDVPDVSSGFILGLTSKILTMVQRIGRLVRIDPNDPQKSGLIVIVYVKDSQEHKWLNSALLEMDSSNITWTSAKEYLEELRSR